jgi:hypothetical protein
MKRWLINYLKDFVHNVLVHPLMMVLPAKLATKLHDTNANWAYDLNRYDELKLENINHE